MTELLSDLLGDREGLFVDVGVNLGQTLLKVKAIDQERPYAGFEPNPVCVHYSRRLVERNQISGCTIVPVALTGQTGLLTLDLYNDSAADASASVVPEFRDPSTVRSSVVVPAFNFDEIRGVLTDQEIAFVKIDVEGAELDVLQSLGGAIARDRPIILLEVLPVYASDNKERLDRQQKIESMLERLHYRIHRVEKTDEGRLAGLNAVESFGIHGDLGACDYVILGEEQLTALSAISPSQV